jgi:hypothetical protein
MKLDGPTPAPRWMITASTNRVVTHTLATDDPQVAVDFIQEVTPTNDLVVVQDRQRRVIRHLRNHTQSYNRRELP